MIIQRNYFREKICFTINNKYDTCHIPVSDKIQTTQNSYRIETIRRIRSVIVIVYIDLKNVSYIPYRNKPTEFELKIFSL